MFFPFHKRKKSISAQIVGQVSAITDTQITPPDMVVSVEGAKQKQGRRMHNRIWLCAFGLVVMFVSLGVRLADVTLKQQPKPIYFANTTRDEILERPAILDVNGRYLAMNRPVTGLAIDTDEISDPDISAIAIASVLENVDIASLATRLARQKYVEIRKELTARERKAVTELGLPGVIFTQEQARVYPQSDLAAHAIGYTIAGHGGVAGLEAAIDRDKHLSENKEVQTTLNIVAQQIMEQELAAAKDKFSAKAAWGILMEVHTGEIVALASLPDYNPNEPGQAPADARRNRAMHDVYELGSAFKVFFAAAALEEKVTDLTSLHDVRHPLKVHDKVIHDFHPRGGYMNLSQILQYSSNIGIARIGLALGKERQQDYLNKFGLISAIKTELPERRMAALPSPWGDVETATITYGHGIAVTPLQLTAGFAAVVNGGIYHQPHFVKKQGKVDAHPVLSTMTSAAMRIILRRIVTDGTGRNAEAEGYYVIGKTATADKPSAQGGYDKDRRLSSFIGAFPGYDPQYVMLVSFDEPMPIEGTYGYATAGIVAAPVFRQLVLRLGPTLNLHPVGDDLAFAKFMGDLNQTGEMRMALASENLLTTNAPIELDDMAKLIQEQGP
ncbi:MAG: peptidoglycan D,D-transpeptidase FtsI family protein [bacterium]